MPSDKSKSSKEKKKKSKRHSSSSSSEFEWTDETTKAVEQQAPEKEETWIHDVTSLDSFMDSFTSSSKKKPAKTAEQTDSAGCSVRELNPFWKEGGSGLPGQNGHSECSGSKSALTVDNKAWLFKSYKRAREQADEEGVNVKEFLLQRWDEATVDDMLSRFERHRNFSSDRYRARSPGKPNRPRWRKERPESDPRTEYEQPLDPAPQSASSISDSRNPEKPPSSNPVAERASSTSVTVETEERDVTQNDINDMAAKVMRAELSGNSVKVEKLQANLDKLREAQSRGIKIRMHVTKRLRDDNTSIGGGRSVIPLTRLNDRGVEMPVRIANLSADPSEASRTKRVKTHTAGGERIAYFADDATEKSVNDLVREERFRSSQDVNDEFTRLASKSGRNVEDEYADAFVSQRSHAARDAQRAKQDAVSSYKRRAFAESNCTICLERVPKHLIVCLGEKVFLSLPSHVSLTAGHCLLTPYEHVGSTTRLDDGTLHELTRFKQKLVTMFQRHLDGASCVFIEMAMRPESARSHAQLECIPVPADVASSLPAYFKKALSELGSEWDQNRRVIQLKSNGMGAHGCIPPKFGYLAIEFGTTGGGLARVIDDASEVPFYFCREIIGSMLEKDSHLWRKPKPDRFDSIREKVVEFENWWESYNEWMDRDPRTVAPANASPTPEGPDLPPEFAL